MTPTRRRARTPTRPRSPLAIDSDLAPLVQITRPEDAETTAPANGQLEVDGTIGDDFGIDKVRLRLRIDGRDLAPVPYMDGKSFLRPATTPGRPTSTFKMSADLSKLNYADGDAVRTEVRDRQATGHRVLGRGDRQLHRDQAGRGLEQPGRQRRPLERQAASPHSARNGAREE